MRAPSVDLRCVRFGCLKFAVASRIFFPRHPALAFVSRQSRLRAAWWLKPKMRAALD